MERIYKPLEYLNNENIDKILARNDINEMSRLPLSVGMNHANWKYAQEVCEKLSKHENANVRANAILGFSYIARIHGRLEKHIVKPIILKELRENKEYEWRIIDSINDINLFLKWNLGKNLK
jgi:hypothetical protein